MHHQASETMHVDERIENFLKEDNSLMIGVWKDSSMEAPILNIFFSKSSLATVTNVVT
jgi:hypothetical protein